MTEAIEITVNGEPQTVPAGVTVAALLERLGVPGKGVAVERNRAIAPKSAYAATLLEPGDRIEIVTVVGGG